MPAQRATADRPLAGAVVVAVEEELVVGEFVVATGTKLPPAISAVVGAVVEFHLLAEAIAAVVCLNQPLIYVLCPE